MVDPFTIKPLDRKLLLESSRATKGRILTVEDHYYEGRAWPAPGTGWGGGPSQEGRWNSSWEPLPPGSSQGP